ncbi:MAG: ABC transporter permease subunit [Parahaliea sp.]
MRWELSVAECLTRNPRLIRWRKGIDYLTTASVVAGGIGILAAILLIFFFLLTQVLPLFQKVQLQALAQLNIGSGEPVYMGVAEQGDISFIIDADGRSRFVDIVSGEVLALYNLGRGDAHLSHVVAGYPQTGILAITYSDGAIDFVKADYHFDYVDGKRILRPNLIRPYADVELQLGQGNIRASALYEAEDQLVLAADIEGQGLQGLYYGPDKEKKPFVIEAEYPVEALYLANKGHWLYRIDKGGTYALYELNTTGRVVTVHKLDDGRLFSAGKTVTATAMLAGDDSLLVASGQGELAQFFMVRTDQTTIKLQRIRDFDTDGLTVSAIIPERHRKVFVTYGKDNYLQIYYSTSGRRLLSQKQPGLRWPVVTALSATGRHLLYLHSGGELGIWQIDNLHPELSWSVLWDRVWYESYDKPRKIWQSSPAADAEPKYSLAPLIFGTLKAALFTMLLVAPLAVCGAIYTAYFMATPLRRKVKPLIELMEALPTVILGFLAALWLAPLLEQYLAALFVAAIALPFIVVIFAYLYFCMCKGRWQHSDNGWLPLILLPLIVLFVTICLLANNPLEHLLFGGDSQHWLLLRFGLDYDQRNALVVAIAMGLAVIPTVFSIAEDAVFSVPGHLSEGALALGATSWQALASVVLPTASPGIFSALIIGFGRSTGETMIVLMAAGNTPLMGANIFEGMRTLAANIAVEMPEATFASTHYRVLILSALLLFVLTFVFNTVAELVRQRLRVRYGSL